MDEAPVSHQTIPQNSAFQIEDLDAYDSDYDDISSAKAVSMANLLSCDSNVLSEVPYSDTYPNDMINQDVQEMTYSKKTHLDDFLDNEINSDSNIIPYSQYLQETQDAGIQDTKSSAPNGLLVLSLEIDALKETLSNNVKEKESLSKTLTVFKTESKEKESKYIGKEVVLEKQNKELENIICKMYRSTQAMHMLTKPHVFYDETHKQALGCQNSLYLKKAQRIKPTLYDGSVIAKEHVVISVIDDEDTLILEEESRSKMLDKQNDPLSIEKKINISQIDYSKLNKIKEDFGKHFVSQTELSAEQAFWLKHLNHSFDTSDKSHTPVRIEAHRELPKVVKKRTTFDAIMASAWGFKHTKACFQTKIIPFIKVLKDTFHAFDKTLLDEITEVQNVFNQMESVVDQYSIDKNDIEIKIKQLSIDNDQLLNQIMSQEIVHIAVNSVDILDVNKSCVDECTQSQEKDTVIRKLKDRIKSLSGKDSVEKVKKDIDEIETINIELEHNLNAQLQEKVFAIVALKNELRKLKEKNVVDTIISKPVATIDQGMFKLDIEPISHRLKNNRDVHAVYLDKTIKYTDTLYGLELLVYVSKTCPNLPKPSEKLVAVTPINKNKRVRFTEPVTSSSNIPKQIDPLKTKDSNKPFLTSTGINTTSSASGSKPSGNIKKNRITRPPKSNKKNKVDVHPRTVKSSLNKTNSISEPINNALVKHYVVQNFLWYLDSRCSKHMIRNRSQLINFVSKVLGTVRFRNDHIAKIMGYGDYQMGNVTISKTHSHKPKAEDSIQEKLYLLHIDLCGLMRVKIINGRKYILVIVDDYSQFTWVKFLCSKDKVPEFVIKFLKMIQGRLNATVHNIRTDNGIEFANRTLRAYDEEVRISHQTLVARSP
ncbi:retrovirus-related pol polyprotein from transposon TNT 1-94 [Tanacetum coccineum]